MEISIYKKWVDNGCKYAEGLALYNLHGKNNSLKILFSSGENDFTKSKLITSLQELPSVNKMIVGDISTHSTTKNGGRPSAAPAPMLKNGAKSKIDKGKLPTHLQKEYDKLHSLIGVMSHKHSQLTVVRTKLQRKQLAKEILENADARRNIFLRIDHWMETGKDLEQRDPVKVKKEETNLKVLQLKDERRLLASQRSKLKKNKKRIKDFNEAIQRIWEIDEELKKLSNE